jgi:ABC-2 type transport system ATP-binding protein
MSTTPAPSPPEAAGVGLEIEDLFQQFGERVAVDHLDAVVGAGEIVGLVGRNGAGKTTTMRAVMGILDPSGGTIRWSGHPVTADVRRRFGYMPEERGLYPQMRVLDQLVYFGRLHGLDRSAAAESARRWIERLGLDGRAEDRVVALSHGNQQRVQLAVALVFQPELVVLDEPFAGLDPSAVDTLSDVLRAEARAGRAILFSSHQLELVERLCDRILILEQGRLLASGTLAELRARVQQRLRVQIAGGNGEWASGLAGVTVVGVDADGVRFALDPGADAQKVLRAAEAAGPVMHFGYESGGLIELYRELVGR